MKIDETKIGKVVAVRTTMGLLVRGTLLKVSEDEITIQTKFENAVISKKYIRNLA